MGVAGMAPLNMNVEVVVVGVLPRYPTPFTRLAWVAAERLAHYSTSWPSDQIACLVRSASIGTSRQLLSRAIRWQYQLILFTSRNNLGAPELVEVL